MKFFTPELFVKLQECASPAELRAVNAEWENAVEQYHTRLKKLAPCLNGVLRRFVKQGSLHDARILDIGTSGRRITLVVQEELVPQLIFLTYSLVEEPVIDRNAFPEEHRTDHVLWLYDELNVEPEMFFHSKRRVTRKILEVAVPGVKSEGWKPIFRHSILLSNGWEIQLRLHRLAMTRATSLLRSDASLQQQEDSFSRSA